MKEKEEETLHYKMLFAFPSGPPLNSNILSLGVHSAEKAQNSANGNPWIGQLLIASNDIYLTKVYLCIWCLKMNNSVVGFQELFGRCMLWLYRIQSKNLTKAFEISMTLCLTRNQWRISKLERKSWQKGIYIFNKKRQN